MDAGTTGVLDHCPTAGTFYYHVRALGSLSDPSPFSAAVVITGGLMFLQLWYYTPPTLRGRLWYLADPTEAYKYTA